MNLIFVAPVRYEALSLGLGARAITLARELCKRGNSVLVLNSLIIKEVESEKIRKELNNRGLEYETCGTTQNYLDAFPMLWSKFIETVTSNTFDGAWLYQPIPQHIVPLLAKKIGRVNGIPLALDWCEHFPVMAIGHRKRTPKSPPIGLLLFPLRHLLARWADHITVCTNALLSQVTQTYLGDPSKICFIPNGIDTNIYRPTISGGTIRRRLGIDGYVVLRLGAFSRSPLYELIPVFERIRKSITDIQLLSIGGLSWEVAQAEEYVKRRSIEEFVKIVGTVPEEELPLYLAVADAFLLNYSMNSPFTPPTFPAKLAPFMAMGKPIIATRFPGIEQFLNRSNSLLIDSIEELEQAIKRLRESPELAEEIGRTARRFAIEELDWSAITEAFCSLFLR